MNKYLLLRAGNNVFNTRSVLVKFLLIISVNLILASGAMAAQRYWVATTASNWNNTANWSNVSGGAGGFSVPGVGDVANFDGNGPGDCNVDIAVSIARLDVGPYTGPPNPPSLTAYTGTINLNGNSFATSAAFNLGGGTFNVGTGTLTVNGAGNFRGGTFNGGAGTITVNGASNFTGGTFNGGTANVTLVGNFVNSGTAFTSTSGILQLNGNATFISGTGSFSNNGGTVKIDALPPGNTAIAGTSPVFNNLELVGEGINYNFTSTGDIQVASDLTISGAAYCIINTGVFDVSGNINITNTATGGGGNAAATINIVGSTNQAISSTVAADQGILPNVNIQKTGGTLTLSGVISVTRDWTYTSGTVDAVSGGSTVVFGGHNLDITSAGMSFNNLEVDANTSTLQTDLTLAGNLTITGGSFLSPGTYTVNLAGDFTVSGGTYNYATSTVNFNGTGLQTVTGVPGGIFYNLTVNNSGAGIQLGSGITVRNALTMTQGNINLNSHTLQLGHDITNGTRGTLNYTSGTMVGTGSFTRYFSPAVIPNGSTLGLFPMGNTTDYRPFYVSRSGAALGGTITVSYLDAAGNTNVSFTDDAGASTVQVRKNAGWTVVENGLSGGTYSLSGQGTGFGLVGDVNDLRLTLANGTVGTAGVNGGIATDPEVNRTGITNVTDLDNTFYIASIDPTSSPLPVTLVAFTATPQNGKVVLNWETSAEINNDYFTVQRSPDATRWDDIARVNGNGNTSTDSWYTATDATPLSGISYYRLKQTDLDGNTHFSPIRAVDLSAAAGIHAWPNPTVDFVYVGGIKDPDHAQILLFNAVGQRVSVPTSPSGTTISLNLSGLGKGIYYLTIIQPNSQQTLTISRR